MIPTVFTDKDILIELWKERREAGDNYIEMMWKGGQFYFIIVSAIISVTFVGLGAFWGVTDIIARIAYLLSLMFLSIIAIAFCWLGETTAERQFRRFLMMVAHINKIEALLGLSASAKLELERVDAFPDDDFLFQRFTQSSLGFRTEDDWIESKVKSGPNSYTNLRTLYLLLAIIGVMFFVLEIFLLISLVMSL